jgi:hypothetical protein
VTDLFARLARAAFVAGVVVSTVSCGGGGTDDDGPGIVNPSNWTVTVTGGAGSGRVVSSPAGIDCRIVNGTTSAPCTATFKNATSLTLTATPDQDQLFQAWGGDCSGATCQLTLTKSVSVSAGFVKKTVTLSLDFRTPAVDDGAAIIAITGPAITALTPTSGVQLAMRTRTADNKTIVLIRGNLTNGVVANVSVSGLDADKSFAPVVEQVSARQSGNYVQRTNLSAYSVTIK